MFKSLIRFIQEARSELLKVTWPTRDQIWDSTKVVILSVVVISLFLGLIDILFSYLIRLVIQ